MQQICDDLEAQHAALDAVVADLDERGWALPTAAEGWNVRDTIFHIYYFDDTAREAVVDPELFQQRMATIMAGQVDPVVLAAALSGPELLSRWRSTRAALVAALRALDPKTRIEWFGPPMSALSFATARLMEAWSHGHDVADALGRTIENTDRIRHIAHLGVVTRGWSYFNRGLAPSEVPVRIELVAPSGATWTWGPDDAADVVRGSAVDFCLVVTQRRLIGDVELEVVGPAATEWMSIAQAFAGPASLTDERRSAAAR